MMLKVIRQVDVEDDNKTVAVAKCSDRGGIVYSVMVAPYIHKKNCGFVFWEEIKRYQDLDTAMRNMMDDYTAWKRKQEERQAKMRARDEEKAKWEREVKERTARAMAELGFEPCGVGTITSKLDEDYVF